MGCLCLSFCVCTGAGGVGSGGVLSRGGVAEAGDDRQKKLDEEDLLKTPGDVDDKARHVHE